MKKNNVWITLIIISLIFMVSFSGCGSISSANDFTEVSMRDYYKKDDFQSIIVGESTYQDVYELFPTESIQVASYGGFCDYPMQNGGYIRIKFYGRDLTVGAIEEFFQPMSTDDSFVH